VLGHCLLGDEQALGDRAVGTALGHEREYLAFPGVSWVAGVRLERLARSFETTSGSMTVPPRATVRSASVNCVSVNTLSMSR
jgi:hypothetical protein